MGAPIPPPMSFPMFGFGFGGGALKPTKPVYKPKRKIK